MFLEIRYKSLGGSKSRGLNMIVRISYAKILRGLNMIARISYVKIL